ncbi:bifunctional nuclease domain-containing protein [Algoriphagus namhaensis]|uniref:Bifunctional nuclease domain-containing protein n=1 Tax=Algoriphagus namhaensis TaxID=915353 RepID=A0ABV8AWS0_9BACT
MEKLVELEILGLSSNHSQSGSFTLVLGETEGARRLPIVIGMFEAQAIAIEIEKIVPNRPMTHDLFKSFATSFNFHLDRIVISDMKEGVFYAKIHGHTDLGDVVIDSRPSDAIAIAVRFESPIFCAEKVMSEAALEFTEEDKAEEKVAQSKSERQSTPKKDPGLKDYSLDRLNQMLDKAISDEDYEKAARIRDEINKRN